MIITMRCKSNSSFSFFLIIFLILVSCCTKSEINPFAEIRIKPLIGNQITVYDFDASESFDPDGLSNQLLYRWDFETDGIWDTDFGRWSLISHQYKALGTFCVTVEIIDGQGLTDTAKGNVVVKAPDLMTDSRDGRIYPIVLLGKMWWMAQNLDFGVLIEANQVQKNNGITEKYRYPGDDTDSLYGGLYIWNEAMDYVTNEGSRGICPPGWRLPTNADWTDLMQGFTDSLMPRYANYTLTNCRFIPDQVVQQSNYFSTASVVRLLKDIGSSGFDAVLVGYRDPDGDFGYKDYYFPGQTASFWTSSSEGNWAFRNRLYLTADNSGEVFKFADNKNFAFSIRCVKNAN